MNFSYWIISEEFDKIIREAKFDPIKALSDGANNYINDLLGTKNLNFFQVISQMIITRVPHTKFYDYASDLVTKVISDLSPEVQMKKQQLDGKTNNFLNILLSIKNGNNPSTNQPIPPNLIEDQLMAAFAEGVKKRLLHVNTKMAIGNKIFSKFGAVRHNIDNLGTELSAKNNTDPLRSAKFINLVLKEIEKSKEGESTPRRIRIELAKKIFLKRVESKSNPDDLLQWINDQIVAGKIQVFNGDKIIPITEPISKPTIVNILRNDIVPATQRVVDQYKQDHPEIAPTTKFINRRKTG